jgi:aminoglycoside phosphotransferase (APT) family kinase protein
VSSGAVDRTEPPRPGEEVDGERLAAWMRDAGLDAAGLSIEQFPSGHSNLTYLVRAGGAEIVLRRPPHGSRVKSAHDMGREHRVLTALHPVFPPAPRPIAWCDDPSILGAPFYLMERRCGVVIRNTLPAALTARPETVRRLSFAVVDNLARLHAIDPRDAGLDGFGKPAGYVRRQIEGWSRRWLDARTSAVAEMDTVARWLDAHMPAESGAAVIHNDYKLDNLMLDPDDPARISAVLDWEMSTVGDPLMDLGTSLAYWVEPGDLPELVAQRFVPTAAPGFPSRDEFVARYFATSGRAPTGVLFYYVYGLFKLAVILQQIYRRWLEGLTLDARFGGLGAMVEALARQAAARIAAPGAHPRTA